MIGIDAAVKPYCRHDTREVPQNSTFGSSITIKIPYDEECAKWGKTRVVMEPPGEAGGSVVVQGIFRLRMCFAFAKHILRSR